MKLILNNIGKIGKASVEINGITVIAGENNTGKSTVGKALYCLFSAFHDIDKTINDERKNLIGRAVSAAFKRIDLNARAAGSKPIAEKICLNREKYLVDNNELRKLIEEMFISADISNEDSDDITVEAVAERILSYLSLDDDTIKSNVLKKILVSEYNMQVGNINNDQDISSISLEIRRQQSIDIEIIDNENVDIKKSVNIYSNIAYIEDPFIIDELESNYMFWGFRNDNHRNKLIKLLEHKRKGSVVSNVIEEMVVSEKFENILDILNKICEGSLDRTEEGYAYVSSKYKKPLSLSNISTGFKTFLILKTLLTNGSVEEGGTIILDEPEIHLHPEWQLVFAELIVLLQKEFGIHILLNTHSPYFLRAIQVYSAKYEIADKCKYYLSEVNDNTATVTDVTDDIEKIYSKLAYPLQKLEDERWQDD